MIGRDLLQRLAFDLPWLLLVPLGLWYARAWWRVARGGPRRSHPAWRLAAFEAGLVLVLVATVSPLEAWGNRVLWVNFTGFLVLTMLAAPLLVLGAPLTLAFRVGSARGRGRLRAFYRSRFVTALTFPIVAWLLFAVLTYLWQFTRLTDDAAAHPVACVDDGDRSAHGRQVACRRQTGQPCAGDKNRDTVHICSTE